MTDTPTPEFRSQPSPIGQRVDGEPDVPAPTFDRNGSTPPVGPNTIPDSNSTSVTAAQVNALRAELERMERRTKAAQPGAFGGAQRHSGSWSQRRETRKQREKRLAMLVKDSKSVMANP